MDTKRRARRKKFIKDRCYSFLDFMSTVFEDYALGHFDASMIGFFTEAGIESEHSMFLYANWDRNFKEQEDCAEVNVERFRQLKETLFVTEMTAEELVTYVEELVEEYRTFDDFALNHPLLAFCAGSEENNSKIQLRKVDM